MHITDFQAEPRGNGWGSKCIELLSDQLQQINIPLTVDNPENEAVQFWDKMKQKGHII